MGGRADVALRRAARLADGYVCGSSAIPNFHAVWDKIYGFASAAGRNPQEIEKAALTFFAIDENKSRAVDACAAYLNRYYGKVRMDIEKNFLVGPPEACAERIASIFQKGLDTLVLGMAMPDLKQLDLLGEKVLPLVKTVA